MGLKGFLKGFVYALRGIWLASHGRNMRIHLVAAVVLTVLAVYFGIGGTKIVILVLAATLVLSLEVNNTAKEKGCDIWCELHGIDRDPKVRDVKDLAAGSVLVAAIGAAIVGSIIFVPILLSHS